MNARRFVTPAGTASKPVALSLSYFLMALLLCCASLGCGSGGNNSNNNNNNNNNTGNAGDSVVRLLNVSPDSSAVDLLIRGRTVAEAVGYLEDADYHEINAGSSTFVVRDSGSFNTIEDSSRSFTRQKQYTIFVFGPFGERKATVVEDNNTEPRQGRVRIRFVNSLSVTSGVDVYIVRPEVDIGSAEPAYRNVSKEKITDYLESEEGRFVMRITNKDDLNIIAESDILELDGDQVRTYALVDSIRGNGGLDIAVFRDRK